MVRGLKEIVRLEAVYLALGAFLVRPVEPDTGNTGPMRAANIMCEVVAHHERFVRLHAAFAHSEIKDRAVRLVNAGLLARYKIVNALGKAETP